MHAKIEKTPWMNKNEAAGYLRISIRSLDRHTKSGKIRAGRLGARVIYQTEDLDRAVLVNNPGQGDSPT